MRKPCCTFFGADPCDRHWELGPRPVIISPGRRHQNSQAGDSEHLMTKPDLGHWDCQLLV